MTCENCIHYDVCVIVQHSNEDYDHYTEFGCEDFKNKADFEEVVRCKDCDIPHNKWTGCPKLNGLIPPPDFFCSYGKRK